MHRVVAGSLTRHLPGVIPRCQHVNTLDRLAGSSMGRAVAPLWVFYPRQLAVYLKIPHPSLPLLHFEWQLMLVKTAKPVMTSTQFQFLLKMAS